MGLETREGGGDTVYVFNTADKTELVLILIPVRRQHAPRHGTDVELGWRCSVTLNQHSAGARDRPDQPATEF